MAQITITIDDAKLSRILDALAVYNNWDASTGITKAQNAKKVIIDDIKQIVRNYEANQAAATARITVETDVNNISIT